MYSIIWKETHHGFGKHGFTTITNGHGVQIHVQAGPHGALVAIAVVLVVVVVVVVVITEERNKKKKYI